MTLVDRTPTTKLCECGMVLTADVYTCDFCGSSECIPIQHADEPESRWLPKPKGWNIRRSPVSFDIGPPPPTPRKRYKTVYPDTGKGWREVGEPPKPLYQRELEISDGYLRKMAIFRHSYGPQIITGIRRLGMQRIGVGNWTALDSNARVRSIKFFGHAHSRSLFVMITELDKEAKA